jgi:hypothetical protein
VKICKDENVEIWNQRLFNKLQIGAFSAPLFNIKIANLKKKHPSYQHAKTLNNKESQEVTVAP